MNFLSLFFLTFILLVSLHTCKCIVVATTWDVGDSHGWTTMDYTQWTSGKDFKQGDTLCKSRLNMIHLFVPLSNTYLSSVGVMIDYVAGM